MSWRKSHSDSRWSRYAPNNEATQRTPRKCSISCSLRTTPMHWMRQRHGALWHTNTHTWLHQTSLVQNVSGMSINRHWSRHAFRHIPKAQYTFKSLLIHGILQFTMLITLRCALHRCSSRDIRRWKLCLMQYQWTSHQESTREKHVCCTKITIVSQTKVKGPMLIHYPRASARGCRKYPQPRTEAHKRKFTVNWLDACEWSFRRFTYGNLVTTSPSSKW